jgi:hypothetical protein
MLFKKRFTLILIAIGFITVIIASGPEERNILREQRREATEKIVQAKLENKKKKYLDIAEKELAEKKVVTPEGEQKTIKEILDDQKKIADEQADAEEKGFVFSEKNEFAPYEVVLVDRMFRRKGSLLSGYGYGIYLGYDKPTHSHFIMVNSNPWRVIDTISYTSIENIGKYKGKKK